METEGANKILVKSFKPSKFCAVLGLTKSNKQQMKITSIVMLGLALVFTGCATQSGDSKPPAKAKTEEKTPQVGMTKEEVIQMFGKTDHQNITSEGETWVYNLNMGEAFIPFNFGYRPKTRIINFGRDGRVASWSYSK
jgi:hypothetical protein